VLNVTALLGRPSGSDGLRYGAADGPARAAERRPVVVWNCTRRCNLACRHCYSDSDARRHPEMSGEEAVAMIRDVAAFGSPALLLSGGEPLIRPDAFDLIAEARAAGLAVTLSSNGTLIDASRARRLADLGVRYVGISIDGIGAVHDAFRGRRRAFARALSGIRALRAEGVRVGMRVTLTPAAIDALPDLFALVEREGVGRVCFYHLVPAGRGAGPAPPRPADAVRPAVERIFDQAERWIAEDRDVEVLTVDNHADGPALLLRLERTDPARAEEVRRALVWNGGARNAAGVGLAAVDWDGWVRPDQFWPGRPLGNVRRRPLSRIWTDPPPGLRALRTRSGRLSGRCRACRFLPMCGGGLASRALATTGHLDAADPACHLRDDEVAATAPARSAGG
jgi:radical SAM protein with 4Fe4S-binding SPASM domain